MGSFGDFFTEKQRKRLTLIQNKDRGRVAEDMAVMYYASNGYEVERTGRGSDFRVRKRNPWTGQVTSTGLREIKSGNAKVSALQTKTKKKSSNYKVDRFNNIF